MILTLLLEEEDWLAQNYTKEGCQSQTLTENGLWQSASCSARLLFSAKEGLISFENVLSKRKKRKKENDIRDCSAVFTVWGNWCKLLLPNIEIQENLS